MIQPSVRKFDVAGLITFVTCIAEAANVVDAVFEDGKVDYKDIGKLPSLLAVAKSAATISWRDIPNEASDIDQSEAQALADAFAKSFNIKSDSVERTIEQGLQTLMTVVYAIAQVRDALARIKTGGWNNAAII